MAACLPVCARTSRPLALRTRQCTHVHRVHSPEHVPHVRVREAQTRRQRSFAIAPARWAVLLPERSGPLTLTPVAGRATHMPPIVDVRDICLAMLYNHTIECYRGIASKGNLEVIRSVVRFDTVVYNVL